MIDIPSHLWYYFDTADKHEIHWRTIEFRFLVLSYSLRRIWTYASKTCTGLQSRKLAEAIFTFFFNVEVSRKCVLQDLGILSFTFHMCITQKYRIYIIHIDILRFIRCNVFAICFTWAVVNTRWPWSWYVFGKSVHVLCGSFAEANLSRRGIERPRAHLYGR